MPPSGGVRFLCLVSFLLLLLTLEHYRYVAQSWDEAPDDPGEVRGLREVEESVWAWWLSLWPSTGGDRKTKKGEETFIPRRQHLRHTQTSSSSRSLQLLGLAALRPLNEANFTIAGRRYVSHPPTHRPTHPSTYLPAHLLTQPFSLFFPIHPSTSSFLFLLSTHPAAAPLPTASSRTASMPFLAPTSLSNMGWPVAAKTSGSARSVKVRYFERDTPLSTFGLRHLSTHPPTHPPREGGESKRPCLCLCST